MTNFEFLKSNPRFAAFADAAVAAEKTLHVDAATCIVNCRRAMEFAVKWMYSADSALVLPYQEQLASLINTDAFKALLGRPLWLRVDFIRKVGNSAAHGGRKIKPGLATLCLRNLHAFLDFVACCYDENYRRTTFDEALLEQGEPLQQPAQEDVDLDRLMEENRALREELTRRREAQQGRYVSNPTGISEYETRKTYIDYMLADAGWVEGRNWLNEVELAGMPNRSGTGFADYVLYDDTGKALAVVEAKKTCVGIEKGRQQAMLYADLLERRHGRRPVIFLTNGFETHIIDNWYPERPVAAVYSKRDLEKLFNLRETRGDITDVSVNTAIAGRYYQEAAVKAVCESLGSDRHRKALLVMATGAGKTRTVIALCEVLLRHGWIRDILFLADRNSLVTQARRAFVNLLPNLSVTDLCETRRDYAAHGVFSTYQTMMNCIDDARDDEGRLFTCGHFDLVICDEAHRSIYNKYRDIFTYFDAPLVGLTATPKEEIDRNTYDVFELENGVPTYGYELAQAVTDGYLVSYRSIETELNFIDNGITYAALSAAEKETYEETFADQDGRMPESIQSSALNNWVFNEDTIQKVLETLMTHGIRVDYGETLGKTIIFARSHEHAEKVLEVFNRTYPHLPDYAKVIDNYITYAQSAIDEFSQPGGMPRIAISVDMLDTGIDVPEVVNLVFFKKVLSKAKFWQMIGRGTRLCPELLDGADKECFFIFDFCGNFRFFRMHQGVQGTVAKTLQGAVFVLKAQMACKLQALEFQTEALQSFRKALVDDLVAKVQALNRGNFAVRQHLRHVEEYADPARYVTLTDENVLDMEAELSPLIQPDADEASAMRFDALLYGLELAHLAGRKYAKGRADLLKRANALAKVANIPAVAAQAALLETVRHTDFLETADITGLESVRIGLRALMKYLPKEGRRYDTDFTDNILSMSWNDAELDDGGLRNYKAKAEAYIRRHQDNPAIAKLRTNIPLTPADVEELERILWSELGTREDYARECGDKPLGAFVRAITGLDMNAAKTAFARFLDGSSLNGRQIHFVNQIIEYIVRNGVMCDLSVLMEPPFDERGDIAEIFGDDLPLLQGIRSVIEGINRNAGIAA